MSFGIDAHDLTTLSVDLKEVGVETVVRLRPVFQETADELKGKWRANASANYLSSARPHAPFYPSTITYETRFTGTVLEAEIGPKHEGQGMLAPILEFGSPTSPAHLDGQKAADAVAPLLVARVDAAIAFALKSANL